LEKIIEWGIYLFIFLLPWQTRLIFREGYLNGYWEYGTASIYGTEILLWAIFLLFFIFLLLKKLHITHNFVFQDIIKIVTIFFVYTLLSIFWADSKSMAFMAWLRLAEGIGLFLILRTLSFDWKKISWVFIFSALIQAGLGIYQFLAQATFASKWLGMALHDPSVLGTIVVETINGRWLRAYGSLPHPNMLGGFLAVAIFLVVALYKKTDTPHKKYFLVFLFSILSIGLLTTFSKSAVLAVVIVFVLFLISSIIFPEIKDNRKVLLKFFFLFSLIAVIFSFIFWEPVSARIFGAGRLEVKSSTERINYISESWQIIKENPIIGVGAGNYTLALHNEINPNLNSWEYQPVHNIYLLILAELGVLGFLVFLLILFCLFLTLQKNNNWYNLSSTILGIIFFRRTEAKKIPSSKENFYYSWKEVLGLFDLENGGILLVLVIGLFDHYFWSLYFGIILFCFCFLLMIKEK
jgi:O-antigen ligase